LPDKDYTPRRWTVGSNSVAFSGLPPVTFFEAPLGSNVIPKQIFTPVHHFANGIRKANWRQEAKLPPRVYVDQLTIIREVSHVTDLRHGDHCLITLNCLRCVNPKIDYFVSLLGSLEIVNWYHHFIIMDDVVSVDTNGLPLTHDGKLATICEYANTLPEILEEVRVASRGSWTLIPLQAFKSFMWKAKCRRGALADY